MMLNHIPDSIEIIDYKDDGKATRHYRFRLLSKTRHSHWHETQAGQFFMLNVPEVGEAPFTFTEPPNEQNEFSALIRKMASVTSALFDLSKGQIVGARGPFGQGWPHTILKDEYILIVAGGCGLAPLVHLINTLIATTENKKIVLIYGARDEQSQMLIAQQKRWLKTITIYHTLDQVSEDSNFNDGFNLLKGTPLDVLPQALSSFNSLPSKVLLCGPEVMMNSIAQTSIGRGIPETSIYLSLERRMHCAVGLCGHCYLGDQYVCKQGPTFSWQQLQSFMSTA